MSKDGGSLKKRRRFALTVAYACTNGDLYMEKSNFLYPAGIKWTKQRKAVYEVLSASEEPLSAVQIYNLILQKSGEGNYAVSRVYRILTAFEEKGYVEKSTFTGEGTVMYEWKREGHTHYAVCLNCHKKLPLQACPFEQVHLAAESDGFLVTGHRLELYGYCKSCKNSRLYTNERENGKKS